jgi:hypothetical protein
VLGPAILEAHRELNPADGIGPFEGFPDRGHGHRARPLTGPLRLVELEGERDGEADPRAVFGQLVQQAIGANGSRAKHAGADDHCQEQER